MKYRDKEKNENLQSKYINVQMESFLIFIQNIKMHFKAVIIIDLSNLKLPYWLMNGKELEEIFVEPGEYQAYNQINLLPR